MPKLRNIFTGALLASGLALASTQPAAPIADPALAQRVRHEIRMYPYYTIFDNIGFRVQNGAVELTGQVSEPFKKSDLERIVARTPGVSTVTDELKLLPLSPFDNRLRAQVAHAIFRDPMLSRYAIQPNPPIHIIVDNGHVTLEGVVNTDAEKNVAGIRANSAGLSFGSVINNLRVENPQPTS